MSRQSNDLPIRSNSNDDAEDTSEVTQLFQDRLTAYRSACDYLTDYVKTTEKMQHTHAKEYEKVLKTVKHPIKEGNHFNQNLGGVAEMFDNIRQNTQGVSDVHGQTSRTLKGSVLPIFETLDNEIKQKQKDFKKGAGKGAKAVDKARKETNKHVELLGQHTAAYDAHARGKVDPSTDPYVLQRGVNHRLGKQIAEENNSRSDLLAVQENFGQFESHIIKTFQNGMGQFYTAVSNQADQQKHLYGNMVETTQRVDPLFEWRGFIQRNNGILIDPQAAPRTLASATFANQNHKSTQAMCQGSLERKSGLMKKWGSSLYVITPSKFLHEFETDDDEKKDPSPEMSLYLPDCSMGGINGNTFAIKGKDHSKKMNLGGAKEYEFRARSEKDAQTWYNVITEIVTGKTPEASEISDISGPQRNVSASQGGQQSGTAASGEYAQGYNDAQRAGSSAAAGTESAGGYGGMGTNPYTNESEERRL